MTYERFLKVLLPLQKEGRIIKEAYKLGVDMINFVDPYNKIINELIKEIYGEDGLDLFSWYCYENDFGQGGLEISDSDKNPICNSHESLWKYLEENYKNKNN